MKFRRGPADGEGDGVVGRGLRTQQDKEWREKGQYGDTIGAVGWLKKVNLKSEDLISQI